MEDLCRGFPFCITQGWNDSLLVVCWIWIKILNPGQFYVCYSERSPCVLIKYDMWLWYDPRMMGNFWSGSESESDFGSYFSIHKCLHWFGWNLPCDFSCDLVVDLDSRSRSVDVCYHSNSGCLAQVLIKYDIWIGLTKEWIQHLLIWIWIQILDPVFWNCWINLYILKPK